MRSRRIEKHRGDYVHSVNCGVFRMCDEVRDRSMKDQKLYLISKQEQRVAFHVLTAIELSERLEEFVTCMMKLRATLKTSLLLLLELKAYPVNCSTHILHVVVRFCKAKLCLDRVRFRDSNFLSISEERSYWITFLRRDLDASATLLQVGKDLGIKSLIQVVHLVHEPACTAVFRPPTLDVSVEERRLLLSSSSLGSTKPRASGPHIVRTGHELFQDGVRFQCLTGFKLAEIASLLFGTLTCHGPTDVSIRNWGLPESPQPVLTTLGAEECEDENSSKSSKSQEHVMSLSELMRLESVVETVKDADNLQDVVSRLSNKFDACMDSESCTRFGTKHAQTIKTRTLSKSWSYTAFSNRSPVKSSRDTPTRKEVRFQISPEMDVAAEDADLPVMDSVPKMEDANSMTMKGKAEEGEQTSTSTTDTKSTDKVSQYVSLGIKSGRKQKLLCGLKVAAKTLGLGIKGKNLWRTKGSKGTMSSPLPSQIALFES